MGKVSPTMAGRNDTEGGDSTTEGQKSKKPSDSRFCQQKLPAWKPMLTAKTVFPYFYAAGVVMIVLGAVLLTTSNTVQEYIYDYTQCKSVDDPSQTCANVVAKYAYTDTSRPNCTCSVSFTISNDYSGQVYLYYGLTNFYQNHRYYVRSRDDLQLLGKTGQPSSTTCEPFLKDSKGQVYAPCGAVANSLFNDTFKLITSSGSQVNVSKNGIAWWSDKTKKYGKPSTWANTTKPPNWAKTAVERNADAYAGDEELLVWMRPAALPNFRKLHGILPQNGLPKDNYTMQIEYNYPVTVFGGTKTFVLSTSSWIGGKNPRLGIAYLVVGCVHVLLGIIFTVLHFKFKLEIDMAGPS